MTGQVKEDILARFGEIGVSVKKGELQFNPRLLRKEEFLTDSKDFKYIDVDGVKKTLVLDSGTFCFTYCQIPVVYQISKKTGVKLFYNDDSNKEFDFLKIDFKTSKKIFERTSEVEKIIVHINNI